MLSRIAILLIIIVIVCLVQVKENFMELKEFEPPLKIPGTCMEKNDCDGDIPVISSSCNKVPNFPPGLLPKNTKLNSEEYSEIPFNRLAPKNGNYTFVIPELKYDGIYSRKIRV